MTPEELQEICALYVLGALEPQEAADLEARLQAGDPDVVRTVSELREVVQVLPHALPPLMPDPGVRARLMSRVQASLPTLDHAHEPEIIAPRTLRQWFSRPLVWLPTAAAALLALAFGWTVVNLQSHIAALQTEIQQLRQAALQGERLVALLTVPNVTILALAGTEHAPEAGARLFWDTKQAEWTVITYGLPVPPSGKVYQLWGLTSGPPLPFGTFDTDAHGTGRIRARLSLAQTGIVGAAISLEPVGGVPQPTGNIVLAGKF
ncbi:MAG: anti-sigma factor [bacterium]|nr:anti-sigma factor [bacterium]